VLINLVGNAIKFTEQGSVTLKVQRLDVEQDEVVLWQFSVDDTGIGIPQEKQDAIFRAFTQADGSISRRFGGTGLGLTISARLVEAMGGRIWLESEVGRGTTFHFSVPLGVAAEAPADETVVKPGTSEDKLDVPLRILLVEDNLVNQKVAVAMLTKRGHHVITARNGLEGLNVVGRDSFDLVLMDVQMPVMNGLEATKAIRASEHGSGRHLPIIAMTAHALREDIDRCRAAGMDGYISKPFQIETLIAELSRVQKLVFTSC
jgi:CheY-like chemotaxis protein